MCRNEEQTVVTLKISYDREKYVSDTTSGTRLNSGDSDDLKSSIAEFVVLYINCISTPYPSNHPPSTESE